MEELGLCSWMAGIRCYIAFLGKKSVADPGMNSEACTHRFVSMHDICIHVVIMML